MGLDHAAIDTLRTRVRREVDEGLLPSCQFALAYRGDLVAFETYGDASNDTRYVVYSATKTFVAGAMWALIGDGLIDVGARVCDYIPEFGSNGKENITVEQVMLHTSGFPAAPLKPLDGATSAGRRAAFARWRTNWEPGTRFEYHATSAHWVLAELIEVVSGQDFRDVVERRVTTPAGLPKVLGALPYRAAPLQVVGAPATSAEIQEVFGVPALPATEVTIEALTAFDTPGVQDVGIPGGGGVMRACDLAMYYQAVLGNPGGMWRNDIIDDARTNVRNTFPDPLTGVPANRTLGLVQAAGDGKDNFRGFGRTVNRGTVGHNGAKGQIAWGDPVTGLSFGYCTNGLDQHEIREPRRTTAIASLAANCATA
ncbi:MAG: serine hydrolase domain-containing protein [Ilumatobacteraceae bacterium]